MRRSLYPAMLALIGVMVACSAASQDLGNSDPNDVAAVGDGGERTTDAASSPVPAEGAAKDTGHSPATPDTPDKTAPVVVLQVTPALVSSAGPLQFSVKVTDASPISKVVIYQDGMELDTLTTAPFSGSLKVTSANNGKYTFTATATDAAHHVGESKSVQVTIAIPRPPVDPIEAGTGDAGTSDADAGNIVAPPGSKRVFVTAGTYTSNLKLEGNGTSGPDGADKLCNKEAQSSGIGGTWKAWIRETGVGSGTLRVGVRGPWARMDGALVFPGTSVSGVPLVPINRTPLNQIVTGNGKVFTALYDDGTSTSSDYDCGGWTDTLGYVNMGSSSRTSAWSWAYYGVSYVCNQTQARLYCFEQ